MGVKLNPKENNIPGPGSYNIPLPKYKGHYLGTS